MTGHRQRTPARRPRPPEESAQPEQRLDAGVDLHGWRLITRWWQVDRATQWPMHQHREHELIWDVSGTLSVTMAGRLWLVPPGAGLWVPSGTEHEVAASVSSSFACTFVEPESTPAPWEEPCVVAINPLTAEALRQNSIIDVALPLRDRIADVAVGMLSQAEEVLTLPLPGDPRARIVADALLADPADGRCVEDWARVAHTSARTLRRLFVEETGMSFLQWRTLLRHRQATALLADGLTVATVAVRVGYRTPSAFSASFRRTMGQPPGRFAQVRQG